VINEDGKRSPFMINSSSIKKNLTTDPPIVKKKKLNKKISLKARTPNVEVDPPLFTQFGSHSDD
jgi:hypothetical protein